jgi:hypothetical protein
MSSYQPFDQYHQSQYASPLQSPVQSDDEEEDEEEHTTLQDRLRIMELENHALALEIEDLQKQLQNEKRKFSELCDDYEFHIRESGRELMQMRNELLRLRRASEGK